MHKSPSVPDLIMREIQIESIMKASISNGALCRMNVAMPRPRSFPKDLVSLDTLDLPRDTEEMKSFASCIASPPEPPEQPTVTKGCNDKMARFGDLVMRRRQFRRKMSSELG